jgi:phosphatidylethanolamine/phosphatidyl-N-methylethanolamine N-methyltransferase
MNKNDKAIRKYRWLSSVYDQTVKNRWFERARQREFELANIHANIQSDHRVLVAGIGTGLDIPYLPKEVEIVGIDLSPEMLERARAKGKHHTISLSIMDVEQLDFDDQSFNVIFMNLILSVVDDPKRALQEAARVLKPSGSTKRLMRQ